MVFLGFVLWWDPGGAAGRRCHADRTPNVRSATLRRRVLVS